MVTSTKLIVDPVQAPVPIHLAVYFFSTLLPVCNVWFRVRCCLNDWLSGWAKDRLYSTVQKMWRFILSTNNNKSEGTIGIVANSQIYLRNVTAPQLYSTSLLLIIIFGCTEVRIHGNFSPISIWRSIGIWYLYVCRSVSVCVLFIFWRVRVSELSRAECRHIGGIDCALRKQCRRRRRWRRPGIFIY